jgi:hypothetical protein
MKKLLLSAALASAVFAWGALPPTGHAKITKELKEELQPSIEKGLESADPLVKAYAALAAGQLKDRTLDKTIVALLENTNTDVRRAAIVALASRKDRKGVQALEAEITKAGSGGGFVAAELLPRLPEKVQVQLLKGWINGRKTSAVMKDAALDYCLCFGRGDIY